MHQSPLTMPQGVENTRLSQLQLLQQKDIFIWNTVSHAIPYENLYLNIRTVYIYICYRSYLTQYSMNDHLVHVPCPHDDTMVSNEDIQNIFEVLTVARSPSVSRCHACKLSDCAKGSPMVPVATWVPCQMKQGKAWNKITSMANIALEQKTIKNLFQETPSNLISHNISSDIWHNPSKQQMSSM